MTPVQQEILELDRQFWNGDEAFYLAHLDETCLVAFAEMACAMRKADVAATARNRHRWSDLTIDVKGIVQPSDDVVLLSYEAGAVREGGEPYRALVSSGYVNRADGWKLMFHTQVPLGG